jgi:hypothetical protein
MNRFTLSLLAILLGLGTLIAAVPDWYNRQSDAQFIIGSGVAGFKTKTALPSAIEAAKEDALQQVCGQIFSDVRSSIKSSEKAGEVNTQFYAKEVQITSNIKLCGYDVINSASDRDHYYIQLRISRAKMADYYKRIVQDEIDRILSTRQLADAEKTNRKAKVLYQQVRALREDLDRDMMILGFLQVQTEYADKLKNVPSIGEIEIAIQKLSTNKAQDYEELALDIIEQLDVRKYADKTYLSGYYEWGNTGFVSEFSSKFSAFLKASFEQHLGWRPPLPGVVPEISMFGEMIDEGKQICLITRIVGINMPPKTVVTYLKPATIASFGRSYLTPKDLDIKQLQDKRLRLDAVSSTNLKVDIRSGEFGKLPAVYHYNERATVEVRANKACWLHLMYLEADGTKCLLFENFPITADMINQWVVIPQDFTVCEPSGIEQLWVQADLQKLPRISNAEKVTISKGFYKTVIKDDLPNTIATTRGLKIAAEDHDFCEAFLTWTIVEGN